MVDAFLRSVWRRQPFFRLDEGGTSGVQLVTNPNHDADTSSIGQLRELVE